jgi:biopolymer transport protein ExbB
MKTTIFSRIVLQLVLVFGAQFMALNTASAQAEADTAIPADLSAATTEYPVENTDAQLDGVTSPQEESAPAEMSGVISELPDAAADAATAAEASTAEAHTGYGLEELWAQGDFVARGTLIIMVIMSAATWYVLVTKLIQQQLLLSQAKATRHFWRGKDLQESMSAYKENSAFRSVAEDGVTALEQHQGRQGEKIDQSEWLATQLQRSVERVIAQLQTGLSLLATVGSCSPFVGLFGTVWGIYNALIAIGLSGQASIDKVAGPVGEALIMTAIGLAVAVPAVLGYNWLVRRNKVIVDGLRNFAADIHANLTMGVKGS